MWAFELAVIYMGVNMNKVKMLLPRKYLLLAVVVVVLAAAATVYAVLPVISLNSPTSFPVDI